MKCKLLFICLVILHPPELQATEFASGSGLTAACGTALNHHITADGLTPALFANLTLPQYSDRVPGAIEEGAFGTDGAGVTGERKAPSRSLRSVILTIEHETGFRFLYRDVIVSGVDIRFAFGDSWQEDLKKELHEAGLDLVLNEERRQIVLFRVGDADQAGFGAQATDLQGYVIDKQTGDRLPFATVIRLTSDHKNRSSSSSAEAPVYIDAPEQAETLEYADAPAYDGNLDYTGSPQYTHIVGMPGRWPDMEPVRLQGVQTDINGRFRMTVPDGEDLYLQVSYVGYHTRLIAVSASELPAIRELPVRLEPAALEGKEIVLNAPVLHQPAGNNSAGSLMLNGFSPLGESNTIRMLQTLPSVGMGTALSDGAYVRGSNSDAMQILLDGTVIYNQSHLFGLVDSFNADAIRTSSFHYDVTPARYQGPPGGTLNLITRAGSLYRFRGNAGISSSALNGSLEGPLMAGRSSLLVSGRTSLLNGYGFPGTEDLVAWGLNVGRPNSLDDDITTLDDRIVTPGSFEVTFHDLHGKLFLEDSHGNRWMLSGYTGFNNTRQEALRLVRPRPVRLEAPLVREQFKTRNRWGNNSANLGWFRALESDRTLHVRTGMSYYHTQYLKEDFSYQRPGRDLNDQLLFIHPFENQSELTHWHVEADLISYRPFDRRGGTASDHARDNHAGDDHAADRSAEDGTGSMFSSLLSSLKNLHSGLALHGYRSAFLEESLNRPRYFLDATPLLLEGYLDSEWVSGGTRSAIPFEAQAGVRLQYFSDGGYLRFSPRFSANLFPQARVSPSFGYSRTYQYLFKLSFYNQTTSDIWITANENQAPAAVDLWSAAMRIRIAGGWFFRTELYYKHQRNLRFHEINIQSVQSPLEGAPWFADNTGHARGLELQTGFSGDRFSLSQSYTLSRTEMSNPRLNEGERFLAYWDRTHQFNTLATLRLFRGFRVAGNWFYATGVPDRLDLFRSGTARLGYYSRIDLSLRYDISSGPHRWAFEAGVYNLTNRKNPWYRDWVQTIRDDRQFRRLEPVQVDFYDLGFQPSFSLRYYLDP